jgi:DNA gyrase/topoisomerase IV, subunit A
MSERTGLGIVEIAILEALHSGQYLRCDTALARVEDQIGLAPGYAYEVLVNLAQPWTMPVSLVHGQGNFGSRGNDPPAGFRYTQARITRTGQLALAAERGDIAPLPIALINGNTYGQGQRPPFQPRAIIDAIRAVIKRPAIADKELTNIAGPPSFVTGCAVTGNLPTLAAGRRTKLRLRAQVTISDDGRVLIENMPPNASTDDTASAIANRARAARWADKHPDLHRRTYLPLADIRNETHERTSPYGRIICTPREGTSPGQLRDLLLDVPGVSTTMPVALPRPMPNLIRHCAQANAQEDLPASLTALEHAIRAQRQ